ncbi:hypothetical protein AC630_38870 [Bradyrhizobium sp. AS23.2]|nr:hypothetical protein AC630_38870 [Bradyrhizobium sp. AS23.2]
MMCENNCEQPPEFLRKMAVGLNAPAIDFAKFGALFLDNGRWRGKHLIPERWAVESTSPDANDTRRWRRAALWKKANGYYKYFWWGLRRPDGAISFTIRAPMFSNLSSSSISFATVTPSSLLLIWLGVG